MAITNAEIITNYKVMNNIPIETPLYTYGVWKAKGYQVKRGEGCRHRVQMWKYKPNTGKTDTESQEGLQPLQDKKKKASNYCYMKTMNLFERSQVEEIKA